MKKIKYFIVGLFTIIRWGIEYIYEIGVDQEYVKDLDERLAKHDKA